MESEDPADRVDRYAKGCALGHRSACLGERGLDWPCEGEACVEACERGEARACTRVGRQEQGDGGNAALWRACDLDDPWGCLMLADRVAAGGANPSPKSLEWLYNQVCDIQLDYGCVGHRYP